MAAASNIMMTLTHYATGTSPVIFGSGYTTLGEWWKAGFVMSLVLIGVWLVVGGAWWKLLGMLVSHGQQQPGDARRRRAMPCARAFRPHLRAMWKRMTLLSVLVRGDARRLSYALRHRRRAG